MEEVIGESRDDDYDTLNKEVAEDEEVEKNQLIERENVSSCTSSNTSKSALSELNKNVI